MAFHVAGPVTVTFNSVAMLTTKAGIMLRPTTQYQPITDDHGGQAPLGQIIAGSSCSVECSMQLRQDNDTGHWNFATAGIPEGIFGSDGPASEVAGGEVVGTLASAYAYTLTITEARGTIKTWIALKAKLLHPEQILLAASQEIDIPMQWLILPDTNNDLFSTVPTYYSGM